VEKCIQEINLVEANYSTRCIEWCFRFMGTPCFYESNLPDLNEDQIRVRLESFDCITFLYTVIALAGATNFEDYVRRLRNIRYKDSQFHNIVSNDPVAGNFLDFACEALLFNGHDCGYIDDITEDVVSGQDDLMSIEMELKPCERPQSHDCNSRVVLPRYQGRKIHTNIIPSNRIDHLGLDRIQDGDIVIFTHGEVSRKGKPQSCLVCHCGFVDINEGKLNFIHATRSFYVDGRNLSDEQLLKQKDEIPKEFLGVWHAGEFLGDNFTIRSENETFSGYRKDKLRLLSDYSLSIFSGVKILRLKG